MDLDHSILTNFELDPISVGSSQLGLKWMSWEESFLFMSGQKQRINIGFRKEGTGYFSRQKLTSFKNEGRFSQAELWRRLFDRDF